MRRGALCALCATRQNRAVPLPHVPESLGGSVRSLRRRRYQGFRVDPGQTGWQSSSRAFREFCGQCGTPLAFRPIDRDIMEMLAGSLDHPERAVPTYAVGREGKLGWVDTI